MDQQRNLFVAIGISIAILIGFQIFYERVFPPKPAPVSQTQTAPAVSGQAASPGQGGATAPGVQGAVQPASRENVLAQSPRVAIATPRLKGSINLTGGRIDDLTLVGYRETVDPDSPEIVLLAPKSTGYPYYADYNTTKAGVIELTKSMALELAPKVRVNAVAPGYVLTPMQRAEYTDAMLDEVNQKIPIRRHAQPEEIAALFAFLASDDAQFITGAIYTIDGGETAGALASR